MLVGDISPVKAAIDTLITFNVFIDPIPTLMEPALLPVGEFSIRPDPSLGLLISPVYSITINRSSLARCPLIIPFFILIRIGGPGPRYGIKGPRQIYSEKHENHQENPQNPHF